MENKSSPSKRPEINFTPIYAGRYRIGNDKDYIDFCLMHKPNWVHRKFCHLLLGWRWIDEKDV